MEKGECFFEVVLYDARNWWSVCDIFSAIHRQGVGIRYDEEHYIIWSSGKLRKVKIKAIAKRVIWHEQKEACCRALLVGKLWLASTNAHGQKFSKGEEFLSKYVEIVTGVSSGKRNKGH